MILNRPPLPFQIDGVTDAYNATLQATSVQLVGAMAVIVGFAVIILLLWQVSESRNRAKAQQQQFELLRTQIESSAAFVKEYMSQGEELRKQSVTLIKIAGDTAANLIVNRDRISIHDLNALHINQLLAAQGMDKTEFMTLLTEIVTKLNAALERNPEFSKDDFLRFEGKLDLLVEYLQLKSKVKS